MEIVPRKALRKNWREPWQQGANVAVYSYLAGFFDGEGHITAASTPTKKYPYISVGATNTIREPIDLLQRLFGGTVACRDRKIPKKRGGTCKPTFHWAARGVDAHWALSRMLPWLLVKRRRAQLAIIILQNVPSVGYFPTEEEEQRLREAATEIGFITFIDNPKRYKLKCIVCSSAFYNRKRNKCKTCSRHCAGIFREGKKKGIYSDSETPELLELSSIRKRPRI